MIEISLELIIALIGAITGVVSLFWHIQKDKPRLILAKAYFEWLNKHIKNPPEDKEIIKFEMELDNVSNRSTTIKDIWFKIGNKTIMERSEHSFHPKVIQGCSSESFIFFLEFGKNEFKNYFNEQGEIELGIDIFHTFGRIPHIVNRTRFETGWLNLRTK